MWKTFYKIICNKKPLHKRYFQQIAEKVDIESNVQPI